jgi:hypothetical protein
MASAGTPIPLLFLLHGPWPRQGKALSIEFRREINGYTDRIVVDFTNRHTGGTQIDAEQTLAPAVCLRVAAAWAAWISKSNRSELNNKKGPAAVLGLLL